MNQPCYVFLVLGKRPFSDSSLTSSPSSFKSACTSKGKALSVLAYKIGRCAYFMLKVQKVFDEQQFLGGGA